jgi:hypothetical protein
MQDGVFASVQPVSGLLKRRTETLREPYQITIEFPQLLDQWLAGSDIEVIKILDRHAFAPDQVSFSHRIYFECKYDFT